MVDIVLAIVLFAGSVLVHLLYCRNTKSRGLHAKTFILMAMAGLVTYFLLTIAIAKMAGFDPRSLIGIPFELTGGVIFILFVPIYLCFYVLTQLMSPSKKILLTVAKGGAISYEDILASIEEENFIKTRLDDLLTCGCVGQVDGRYVLTAEGRKIAAILNAMQALLGRKPGG